MKNIPSLTRFIWLLVAFLSVQQARAQQDFWEPTNGPWGSFVNSLAIDNQTGDFYLAGYAGVYRSVDKGNTWMLAGLLRQYYLRAVVINSSGHIFVGGEEGIFRSTNQGHTWVKLFSAFLDNVHSLIIDRNDQLYCADLYQSVYRSTDNGNTWTSIGLSSPRALAVDNNNRILAATEHGIRRFDGSSWTTLGLTSKDLGSVAVNSAGHIFTVQVFGSVFRSTDDGKTWTETGLINGDVRVLGISSSDQLFAGCFGGGIFRSGDNGDHWVSTGLNDEQFVNDLTFDNSDQLFASTSSGVYWSSDSGENWQEANTGLRDIYIGALGLDDAGNLYAGERDKGIFQTSDMGDSWKNIGLKNVNYVQAIAVNASGHIFVGTNYWGIYRSTDQGNTWYQLGVPGEGPETVDDILITPEGTIFVGSGQGWFRLSGIFRSSDNGDSWAPIDDIGNIVSALAINSSGHIFAGSNWEDNKGLYVSVDNGENWEPLGLSDPVNALVINSSDQIFAGTAGNGIFRSADNGAAWQAVNAGLTADTILDMEVNSSGVLFAATPQGVFRSTDNGDNWDLINTGLANLAVTDLVVNKAGFLFAGTDGSGVFRSTTSTTGLKETAVTAALLGQNTPNPVANTTRIPYEVTQQGPVNISVYDIANRLVRTLVDRTQAPGSYALTLDAGSLENGVYFYVMQAGNGAVFTRKMIVLR